MANLTRRLHLPFSHFKPLNIHHNSLKVLTRGLSGSLITNPDSKLQNSGWQIHRNRPFKYIWQKSEDLRVRGVQYTYIHTGQHMTL